MDQGPAKVGSQGGQGTMPVFWSIFSFVLTARRNRLSTH